MLSLNTAPGLCVNDSEDFWLLRVSKDFDQPEYFIGQTVWHRMKHPAGEILHPVEVIGLWWNGLDWNYIVSLPEDHPQFVPENNQVIEVEDWQIEEM
jgi:hypothetical protein